MRDNLPGRRFDQFARKVAFLDCPVGPVAFKRLYAEFRRALDHSLTRQIPLGRIRHEVEDEVSAAAGDVSYASMPDNADVRPGGAHFVHEEHGALAQWEQAIRLIEIQCRHQAVVAVLPETHVGRSERWGFPSSIAVARHDQIEHRLVSILSHR